MTWASKIDASASIMEASTTYKIFKNTNFDQVEDYEAKYTRFWRRDSKSESSLPHTLNFTVWKDSMRIRYFFEMLMFALQVIVLTYFISLFNKDMHLMEKDHHHLEELKAIPIKTKAMLKELEKTADHMGEEIVHAVTELNEAMDIGIIALTFPLQILLGVLYSKLTKRVFRLRSSNYLDFAICACILVWFEMFEIYNHRDSKGFGLMSPPHPYHKFLNNVVDDINSGNFHFDWLMAGTAFFFWIRMLFMLQLTQTFGPLIRIISAMGTDLVTFFFLFGI